MPARPSIRLVCFDLGGVVVRICRTWGEACAAAGLPVHPVLDRPGDLTLRRELSARHQSGAMESSEFFERLARITGDVYTPGEVALIHDAWLLHEYPGIDAVVDGLLAIPGVETGILSNTNEPHWARLMGHTPPSRPEFRTPARLRHRHASHLLRHAKPAPTIYAEFTRRTGYADRPGEILFFDDLEENIGAARAAGWRAERIDPDADPAAQIRRWLGAYGVV